MSNLRALVAATAATGLLAGCVDEPSSVPAQPSGAQAALRAAELRTVGVPGPQDLPFGEALVTYSRELAGMHAFDEARAGASIRWAVVQLATILDRIPAAAAEPALHQAATRMRALTESSGDEENVAQNRRALTIAATALLHLAEDTYGDVPEIAARARAFAGAVEAIDPRREPPDRPGELNALRRAESALAAIYAANVAPRR